MYYILRALLVCSVVLPILAGIALGFRFYARKFRGLNWEWDDWLAFTAWVFTVAICALNFYAVLTLGLGQPPPTLKEWQIIASYKFLYSVILINYFTYGILKVSVICFYKRIFSVGTFTLWANILIATVVAWTIAGIFAQAFATTPVKDFFIGKTTIAWGKFNVIMACLDLVFDILVLCLPLIAIRELQVSRKQKFSIVGLFWLGCVCVISSAMRIYYDYEWSILGPQSSLDWFQYIVSNTNLWLVIEGNVSIIAACMPTLGGLLRVKMPALFGSSARSAAASRGPATFKNVGSTGYSQVTEPKQPFITDVERCLPQSDAEDVELEEESARSGRSSGTGLQGIKVQTTYGWESTER